MVSNTIRGARWEFPVEKLCHLFLVFLMGCLVGWM